MIEFYRQLATPNARLLYRELISEELFPYAWHTESQEIAYFLKNCQGLREAKADEFIYFMANPSGEVSEIWVAREVIGVLSPEEEEGLEDFSLYDLDQGNVFSLEIPLIDQGEALSMQKILHYYNIFRERLKHDGQFFSSTWRLRINPVMVEPNDFFLKVFLEIFQDENNLNP